MGKNQGARRRPSKQTLGVCAVALVSLASLSLTQPGARNHSAGEAILSSHARTAGGHADVAPCSLEASLCLEQGRFEVQVTWKTPDGASGAGHPVALTSNSGYFWFFEPGNVELAVKTLNGCGINQRRWIFAAGLTSVEVSITVTDTATGAVKTYENPQGRAFQTITDTAAFEGCTDADISAGSRNPEEPLEEAARMAVPDRAVLTVRSLEIGCAASETALCIKGRFQVEADWQTTSGWSGPAYAVPLTSESGYFWFFEPSNVELIVKVLDACSIEQGNWFFGAGMTDVGVELRVTDTYTGESRTFSNPLGVPFAPIQDTGGFAFCPTATPTPIRTPTKTETPEPTRTPVGGPGSVPKISSARVVGSTLEVRGSHLGGCTLSWSTNALSMGLSNGRECESHDRRMARCRSGSDTIVQLLGPFAKVSVCPGSGGAWHSVCVEPGSGKAVCHLYSP